MIFSQSGGRLKISTEEYMVSIRDGYASGDGYIDLYYCNVTKSDDQAPGRFMNMRDLSTLPYPSYNSRIAWERNWYTDSLLDQSTGQQMMGTVTQPAIQGLVVYLPYSDYNLATDVGSHSLVVGGGNITLDTGTPVAVGAAGIYDLDDGDSGYIILQVWEVPADGTYTFVVNTREGV